MGASTIVLSPTNVPFLTHPPLKLRMLLIGKKPQKIRFELMGINIIRNQEIGISSKNEVLISLGGPIANAIIFVFCCLLLCFYKNDSIMTFAFATGHNRLIPTTQLS